MLSNLRSIYGPRYAVTLIVLLKNADGLSWRFLAHYWQTQDFAKVEIRPEMFVSPNARSAVFTLRAGMALELLIGIGLIYLGVWQNLSGGLPIGAALIVAYPLVWAHLLAIVIFISNVIHPKCTGRKVICGILERQVRDLREKHKFSVVAVAGSVGKTSVKLAIAKVLSADKRVIFEEGNYNDRVTVPLVLFGQREPSLLNAFAWLRVFAKNRRVIRGDYPYDIAVLELGSDGLGQLADFAYLAPDLMVVTAVAPEHMEYFGNMDTVAKEELSVAAYSERLLIGSDDIDSKYLAELGQFTTYGLKSSADYYATYRKSNSLNGQKANFHLPVGKTLSTNIKYLGDQGVKIVLSAVAVADMLGLDDEIIKKAVEQLTPFAGRMQILEGQQDSTLIDDTYNSSPTAAIAALDVLQSAKASKRIAIMGSMNELGASSQEAHAEVGAYCDPKKIDLLVTIGHEAKDYLAPAAEKNGCTVKSFKSPYEAGKSVAGELVKGSVVLAKGSQNGVFAEEALKPLLKNPDDSSKLVRQSPYWHRVKHAQFGG